MEFYSLEPFGEERADLRNGMLATAVLRSLGVKNIKPEHFLIGDSEKKKPRMSVAEMQANLLLAVGGRVRYVGKDGT